MKPCVRDTTARSRGVPFPRIAAPGAEGRAVPLGGGAGRAVVASAVSLVVPHRAKPGRMG